MSNLLNYFLKQNQNNRTILWNLIMPNCGLCDYCSSLKVFYCYGIVWFVSAYQMLYPNCHLAFWRLVMNIFGCICFCYTRWNLLWLSFKLIWMLFKYIEKRVKNLFWWNFSKSDFFMSILIRWLYFACSCLHSATGFKPESI